MNRYLGAMTLGGMLAAGNVLAQQQQPALPTTVQLPSFAFFSVNTTVSVPDSGGAYLGGVKRARDSSTTRGFGPLAGRGIGGDRLASGVSVHATIIDHDELDKAVLARAAARRGAVDPDAAKAAELSRHIGREPTGATAGLPSSGPLAGSVAAIRASNAAAAEARAGEAAKYFAQAQQAEAAGKPAVARIFYQMVVRRDGGELKQAAELRLAALAPAKAGAVAKR